MISIYSTNYTYGEPSLLVKQAAKNSWANNYYKRNINLANYVKQEQKKLKGCFIPHLFFGYASSKPIMERMCDVNKLNFYTLDQVIKKIIISGYITSRVVSEKLKYILPDMEIDLIKDDVIKRMLDPIINSSVQYKTKPVFIAYKANFEKNYIATILNARETAYKGWTMFKPSKEVMDMFEHGYIYGHRDTSSKKWNWLKGLTPEQVATRFFENGIIELDACAKQRIKTTEGLSIKAVNDILKAKVKTLSSDEIIKIKRNNAINEWFNDFDDEDKLKLIDMINRKRDNQFQIQAYKDYMINEYGYNKEWIIDGKLRFTKEIKEFIDSQTTELA